MTSIIELKSAYLATMDNFLSLDCYNYKTIDAWKGWSEAKWLNFVYIVKEYLKVDNSYWLDHLPDAWDNSLWLMWDVFVRKYIEQES
jgi:hypothetical protein